MVDDREYVELVRRGQLGDREVINLLAGKVRQRLCQHIYRITLRDDITQDVVQESLLEMSKILGKLQDADRFWPWLCGIASRKLRRHYRSERRQRAISRSLAEKAGPKADNRDGVADMLAAELKESVLAAMANLRARQREVLALRCYEQMPYARIARVMDCSEFSARMLFCRAKKSLRKELSRAGLKKGMLLSALVLFGRMTLQAEGATVAVSSTTLKVGATAAVASAVASKTAVVAVTAGLVAGGAAVTVVDQVDRRAERDDGVQTQQKASVGARPGVSAADKGQWWYYFPDNSDGAVMMRQVSWSGNGNGRHSQVLQNDYANYWYDRSSNRVYMNNYRVWRGDLSVQRLPNDSDELRAFLARVENCRVETGYVADDSDGVLVIDAPEGSGAGAPPQVSYHANVLEEAYFQCDWPSNADLVDRRDSMHRRGWTWFTVDGELGSQRVNGTGRIPFVHAAGQMHWPWLRLQCADGREIIDWVSGAAVYEADGSMAARYEGGTFLLGLSRPWLGLHTIDTVRRDAAEHGLWFETEYDAATHQSEITVTYDAGRIVYLVDMDRDLVERIALFGRRGNVWEEQGELRLSYQAEVDQSSGDFAEPKGTGYGGLADEQPGMLWPVHVAEGRLGN